MAEARSIATLSEELYNNDLKLGYSPEDGISIQMSFVIPPIPRIWYLIKRKFFRVRNSLLDSLYPFGLIASVVASVVMSIYVFLFREECSSIWCVGSLVALAEYFVSWLPFIRFLPSQAQLLYAGVISGFLFALLIATLERYILRALLHWHGWMQVRRGPPPLYLKVWGFVVKALSAGQPMLYSFQGCLPRLPVPPIKQTVERYLESVESLMTAEEFAKTRSLADAFVAHEAPKLQRYLKLKSWWATNYVSDWWLNYVYLRGRSPIMINSNYYVTDSMVPLKTNKPTARAARMIVEFLEFKRLLDHELIAPLKLGGIVPLCMDQYKNMFATTRVPGREQDVLVTAEQSKHVAVHCKGNWYSLPCFEGKTGRMLTAGELEDQLALIVADATLHPEDNPAALALPALTAWNRTRWAEARATLLSNPRNKRTLSEIESAMFHIILDDSSPSTLSEQGHANIHGTGSNRWFDKSLSLIVYANARLGMNVEHAFGDALVIAHLWEHVLLTSESKQIHYDASGSNIRGPHEMRSMLTLSKKLPWDLNPLSRIGQAIATATTDAQVLIADLDLEVFHQNAYGKELIKVFGVSPDSFVQMAMQLAYYKDAGRHVLTYEASSARLFRDGRTETIRSASREATAWVKSMFSAECTREDRRRALRAACLRHVTLTTDAMTGGGIDRHLFCLYVVSIGVKVESEFLKHALAQPWVLSTSQQPIQQTERWDPSKNAADAARMSPGGGFGPVAENGYGCSYLVAGDGGGIYFHITSKVSAPETSSKRFIGHLKEAFADMRALMEGD